MDKDLFKSLILIALEQSYSKSSNISPTHLITKEVLLEDGVNIFSIQKQLEEISLNTGVPLENITIESCYDEYTQMEGLFAFYKIETNRTEKEILDIRKKRFNNSSFRPIYDLLTNNGFKRIPVDSKLFNNFKDTTVYDMYINKDFDRLVDYYSLYFKEIETHCA